ncbi:MAG: 2,3-bisphosphoglycerate-independent phosphoglycerate mutase [Patescibacteria group bacterium]|nr:2,3-bisphosphoglycerate-independent phosphoglycerate mutase [Patescibacteria group bacterium]
MNKVLLIILDGFGYAKKGPGNAIELANMKFEKSLRKKYPTVKLKAHGEAVGLPKGSMGGSEVGHFTMGAGKVVWQSLEMINREIHNKNFFKNKELLKAIKNCKKHGTALHLIGMISDEGVHSHLNHLFACLELAKQHGLNKVFIHAITDGRDVPERSAKKYIRKIQKFGYGEITTIVGRFYAMDRDTNWKRTQKAYELFTKAKGISEKDPLKAIDNAYARGEETDYYLKPMAINPDGRIKNRDSVIFWNFRTDRAKQLTQAFVDPKFKGFTRKRVGHLVFICCGEYSKLAPVAFPAPFVKENLGKILSKKGIPQLRIAETEKYAHVTFFFNSQDKEPYPLEDRILIPSPKVPSYAQKPEMSASKVTNKACKEIAKEKYGFVALNYANGDLVGHSGDLKATIESCKHLDKCLAKIIPAALKHDYEILLTADHGNADQMKYPDGSDMPAHSLNPVLCTLISDQKYKLHKGKGLSAIGPTVLKLLEVKRGKEMGEGLI